MKFSRRVFCLSSLSALGVASILPKLSFARQTSSIPLSVVNAQNGKAISGLLGQKMCRKIDDILVCPMTGQKGQLDYRLVKILFVMARYMNDKGRKDVLWEPGKTLKEQT